MIKTNAINIHIVGNGEPAIIFVHGFGCDLTDWSAQVDALSADFRCVALDLPGHGASPLPRETTIAALAAAVNVAKERSGARQVILVGHSLAGRIIREAYHQSKEGVAGFVMVDTRHDAEVSRQRVLDTLNAEGYDHYIRSRFGPMILDRNAHLYRERFAERAVKLGPEFGQALFLEMIRWDSERGEDTLREIAAVPVVVLQSTYTDANGARACMKPGITTPFMDLAAKLIPTAQMKAVTDAGHFTMLDAPDVVTREIRDLAERIAAR